MIPPKPQNLTSTTIGSRRRSYHWIFGPTGGDELDITISNKFISFKFDIRGNPPLWFSFDDMWCDYQKCDTPIEYIQNQWMMTNELSMKIFSWFDGTGSFMDFLVHEYEDLNCPGQLSSIL